MKLSRYLKSEYLIILWIFVECIFIVHIMPIPLPNMHLIEFLYSCPDRLDKHFFEFLNNDQEAFYWLTPILHAYWLGWKIGLWLLYLYESPIFVVLRFIWKLHVDINYQTGSEIALFILWIYRSLLWIYHSIQDVILWLLDWSEEIVRDWIGLVREFIWWWYKFEFTLWYYNFNYGIGQRIGFWLLNVFEFLSWFISWYYDFNYGIGQRIGFWLIVIGSLYYDIGYGIGQIIGGWLLDLYESPIFIFLRFIWRLHVDINYQTGSEIALFILWIYRLLFWIYYFVQDTILLVFALIWWGLTEVVWPWYYNFNYNIGQKIGLWLLDSCLYIKVWFFESFFPEFQSFIHEYVIFPYNIGRKLALWLLSIDYVLTLPMPNGRVEYFHYTALIEWYIKYCYEMGCILGNRIHHIYIIHSTLPWVQLYWDSFYGIGCLIGYCTNLIYLVLLSPYSYIFIIFFINSIIYILIVALFTLFERLILASAQIRKGPNFVGFSGIAQPFADAVKLLFKELVFPKKINFWLFILMPFFMLFLSVLALFFFPSNSLSFLSLPNYIFSITFVSSSLNAIFVILIGWSSNSRYALQGAMRSIPQMVSHELPFGIVLLNMLFIYGDFDLLKIVHLQQYGWGSLHFSAFILFFVSALGEVNRTPFDLAEAESELVSGYNTEHGSVSFTYMFLAEYIYIFVVSNIIVLLFLGGWVFPPITTTPNISVYETIIYFTKLCFVLYTFILIRATLPRYRYDQSMYPGWMVLLPMSFNSFFIDWIFLSINDGFPNFRILW